MVYYKLWWFSKKYFLEDNNDQSGSIGDIEEGMGRDGDDYGLGRRIISSSVDGNISYQGEGEGRPNVLGQGISSEISNKGQSRIFLDKVKAELEAFAFYVEESAGLQSISN